MLKHAGAGEVSSEAESQSGEKAGREAQVEGRSTTCHRVNSVVENESADKSSEADQDRSMFNDVQQL